MYLPGWGAKRPDLSDLAQGRDELVHGYAIIRRARMSDVTKLLDRWNRGDAAAFNDLMPLVYEELHRLAGHYLRGERDGHTLQPTALVHEAYLRLAGVRAAQFQNRVHFY